MSMQLRAQFGGRGIRPDQALDVPVNRPLTVCIDTPMPDNTASKLAECQA